MSNSNQSSSGAYLEITLDIKDENRSNAGAVYVKYKQPFLDRIKGAVSKQLLLRSDDVQVLHGFKTEEDVNEYLKSELFQQDVVRELKPYLESDPEIRIYSVFSN
ncbi:MAG: hypothetical protein ABJF93_19915 [Balneola sp.]